MLHYHRLAPLTVTVDCDTQADLVEAILDMDRFQDGWWRCSLRDSALILATYQPTTR